MDFGGVSCFDLFCSVWERGVWRVRLASAGKEECKKKASKLV